MNYCSINDENKSHLLKLIDFIYHEVIRSGGDGDALWYSRFYNVKDIFPLIQEYNSKLKYPWGIRDNGDHIHWGIDQEWALITNNEEHYKTAPSWEQILIRY